MLKKIPEILSPSLVKALMEMGHGDTVVIADGNFPAYSQGVPVIDGDGHTVLEYLDAILPFFPLDPYTEKPVSLMEVSKGDATIPTVWDDYKKSIEKEGYTVDIIDEVERFAFYEASKKSYVIISTSDRALYGNIILQKGVV